MVEKRKTNLDTYNRGRLDGFHAKRSIWAYVSQHPGCTYREISRGIGLARTTVYHHVSGLLKTGVLVASHTQAGIRKSRTLRVSVPLLTAKKGS